MEERINFRPQVQALKTRTSYIFTLLLDAEATPAPPDMDQILAQIQKLHQEVETLSTEQELKKAPQASAYVQRCMRDCLLDNYSNVGELLLRMRPTSKESLYISLRKEVTSMLAKIIELEVQSRKETICLAHTD